MTGFKFNVKALTKKLDSLANIRAIAFAPAVRKFATRTLNTAVKLTPSREAATITKSQRKQYWNRCNYIPSIHHEDDPRLIVTDQDEHWIYSSGNWYNGAWHLPDEVWMNLQALEQERDRRLELTQAEFIARRKISRGLYKLSWSQCGGSLGIPVQVPGYASAAMSRRRPMKAPPKGYAIERGADKVYSIQIYNPFLDKKTTYWNGNGKQILANAAAVHYPAFEMDLAKQTAKEIQKASHV